jgi:hypothetical protein
VLSEVEQRLGLARRQTACRLVSLIVAACAGRPGTRVGWLCGRENGQKRYLIHVAGYNLGSIVRLLTGAGTPRGFRARFSTWLFAADAGQLPDGRLCLLQATINVSLSPS